MLDKTQALLSQGTSVRISKRRRQVGSEFATFLDSFWREDEPWVVLRLPSGRRTAVPASWTDLRSDCLAAPKTEPEILPLALLELTRYCQGLRRVRRQTSGPKNRPHKK